jgi:hypothetical protein
MSDIDAMQSRIMAALDRIGQGLDGLSAVGDAAEADGLRQQIDDEKLANAQLEERVKQLGSRAREAEAALAAVDGADSTKADEDAARVKALKRIDGEMQSLRHANQQLRENNAALRAANANGVAEPHLINKAMMAELDGLRAARAADRAEMDVILTELGQIMSLNADGATGSETAQPEQSDKPDHADRNTGMEDA